MRVLEMFAGVGGFRIGLEDANRRLGKDFFEVVWSNQWEPSTRAQRASEVYIRRFGPEGHVNKDINAIPAHDIPPGDLLVAGFPCQDYSVATALQRAGGLRGSKGVLWWEIHRVLRDSRHRPMFLMLENVDRLLKSPVAQRGRDFAVMLASLSDLGYAVEWRVVNAADYGMPQRRRRVFIMGYLRGTAAYRQLSLQETQSQWLSETGVVSRSFPIKYANPTRENTFELEGPLSAISAGFNPGGKHSPFLVSGAMVNRTVVTRQGTPRYSGTHETLRDIMLQEDEVPNEFFITEGFDIWRYLKGSKRIPMVNKATGLEYVYSEGGISYPDDPDRPSRTIVTGEGGASPSRFKHVVRTSSGRLRRLTPIELERLNMFPDNHTEGLSNTQRAFLMGNALVTGIIRTLGHELAEHCMTLEPSYIETIHQQSHLAAAD